MIKSVETECTFRNFLRLCLNSYYLARLFNENTCYFSEYHVLYHEIENIKSGAEYLSYIQSETYLNSLLRICSAISNVIVCEEQYNFAADAFLNHCMKRRKCSWWTSSTFETMLSHWFNDFTSFLYKIFPPVLSKIFAKLLAAQPLYGGKPSSAY